MPRADHFRALGDPNRLRILGLLGRSELAVAEIQEILGIGQSTASGHLAQLRNAGLVAARRVGQQSRYHVAVPPGEDALVGLATGAPLADGDQQALDRVLAARVDPAPDGLGPDYQPGRSWEALAHLLLGILPPLRIADLGVGTGALTQLLAARARQVIAIDSDIEALRRLPPPIETRHGRIEEPPLREREVDLVLLSQSLHMVEEPVPVLARLRDALVGGGRIAVLDLAPHEHTWVRHRLGHRHLGFTDLGALLRDAGFHDVTATVVHVGARAPAFTTVLGLGTK
jgi:ArsR family transcriptional regulator